MSFLQVFFLNPEKYDDVTVERALTKICGYPLCRGQLGPVKKQQYHISLKDNKVYDITERKVSRENYTIKILGKKCVTVFFVLFQNFCSNLCFKGSNYFKKQIPTSPLWLREREKKVKVVFLDESEV